MAFPVTPSGTRLRIGEPDGRTAADARSRRGRPTNRAEVQPGLGVAPSTSEERNNGHPPKLEAMPATDGIAPDDPHPQSRAPSGCGFQILPAPGLARKHDLERVDRFLFPPARDLDIGRRSREGIEGCTESEPHAPLSDPRSRYSEKSPMPRSIRRIMSAISAAPFFGSWPPRPIPRDSRLRNTARPPGRQRLHPSGRSARLPLRSAYSRKRVQRPPPPFPRPPLRVGWSRRPTKDGRERVGHGVQDQGPFPFFWISREDS